MENGHYYIYITPLTDIFWLSTLSTYTFSVFEMVWMPGMYCVPVYSVYHFTEFADFVDYFDRCNVNLVSSGFDFSAGPPFLAMFLFITRVHHVNRYYSVLYTIIP